MSSSSSSNPVKSQYHHFVPRFILRNFAHPFQPPNPSNEPGKGRGKGVKRGGKNGHKVYPGDPMLHAIDCSKPMAEIIEIPVARTFGMTDMYRDVADASNQHHLEEKLSQLEGRVGQIVTKIRKAFEAGEQDVCITRPEKDTLRKFLFIMRYRNSTFFKRWNHPTAESYSANDRDSVLSYMQKKGFTKPMDVWFENIKAMLDVKMDVGLKWMEQLRQRAYPDDATWFILHERAMHLALCTPSGKEGEFLLTENSYGIHEGPVSVTTDLVTGETEMTAYTEFHVFGLITPKLIMVLRSFLLPNPAEDTDEEVKRWREEMRLLTANAHCDPGSAANSLLEDLPVAKASIQGDGQSLGASDKFYFRFFRISTKHVNIINGVFLEESYKSKIIIFKSRQAARKALEYYLKNCFKFMGLDESRVVRLRKLEQAAQLLGSEVPAVNRKLDSRTNKQDDFQVQHSKQQGGSVFPV